MSRLNDIKFPVKEVAVTTPELTFILVAVKVSLGSINCAFF